MTNKLSRRQIAEFMANRIAKNGKIAKRDVLELAALLTTDKRQKEAELLVEDILDNLAEHKIILTKVKSAYALNDDNRKAITRYVKKHTGGQQIHIREEVDPELIGGYVLQTPGQMVDFSIRHRINLIKNNEQKKII